MRVLVTTEARFDRTADGACWVVGSERYGFWRRYLDVFEAVTVLARVRDVETPSTAARVDGAGVTVTPLPYYVGPQAFLRQYPSLRRAVRDAVTPDCAIIARLPGMVGILVLAPAVKAARPYGVEVIGDPYDVFAPGGVGAALRPLLRYWEPRTLRRYCASACAVAYVTARTLQARYPAPTATVATSYSSIDLPESAFLHDRQFISPRPPYRLISAGSLEQLYKGPDVLIDAVQLAKARGFDLQATWLGEGRYRADLERRARDRGVDDRVFFIGHLQPETAVRAALDRADLFVLPSRTEGLPRALIEAMARGLPCIASDVGGVPELLATSERVPAGDPVALAHTLQEVLSDPPRLARLAESNLTRALEYHADILRPRRHAMYQAVHDATRAWQQRQRLTVG